jgi:hypothetical protein
MFRQSASIACCYRKSTLCACSPDDRYHLEFFTPGNIGKAGQNELPQIVAVMRARGKLYSSPAGSLPKSRQLAAKSQSYLNSYRYIGFQRSISDQKQKKRCQEFFKSEPFTN